MKNTLITIPDQFRKVIFIILLALCIVLPLDAVPGMPLYVNAPVALLLGLIVAIFIGHPYLKINKKATTILLQVSVVLLGFHLDMNKAIKAGSQGVVFTIFTIALTLGIGYMLGKWLKIDKKISLLISNGTAICGGSAIAAVAPVIEANDQEISVSLGTVFILNSIALMIFPAIGHFFDLSANQFGTWCAIAIHDTSSVVGAANSYHDPTGTALAVATTVKLVRALWIIPITLITAYFQKTSGKKIKLPYFIFYFVIAIVIYSKLPLYIPSLNTPFSLHAPFAQHDENIFGYLNIVGRKGLVLTLFLIGSGLSLNTIRQVGFKPILQGVLLWILIGSVSLFVITHTLS